MRTILISFLFLALTLSVCGCFGSRERGEKADSGLNQTDVTAETSGRGGRDSPRAGAGAIDGGSAGIGGSGIRSLDAAIVDGVIVQAGSGGSERTGGTGRNGVVDIDIDDDAGITDAPCAPDCPEMDWVTIEGGTFIMGSAEGIGGDDERPQHEVTVQTFKMSKTEVTEIQFGTCLDAGKCQGIPGLGPTIYIDESTRENRPASGVTWDQAKEYAEWLGGRLPSESEWEYAARSGGRDYIYPWGNDDITCERAVIGSDVSGNDCGNETAMEVCSKPSGNTLQGLCDMVGNVREWIEDDWHASYFGAPSDGQAWIESYRGRRVMRGGSWYDVSDDCRSAARSNKSYPGHRFAFLGFRVVLDIK